MEENREISKLFSKCVTSLCLIIFEADSNLLKTKIQQNVHNLLISFTSLRQNYEKVEENNAVEYQNIKNKIDNLVDLLEILEDSEKIKSATSLPAVKNLLFFKLFLLNSYSSQKQSNLKEEADRAIKPLKNNNLNGLAKKIFEFIKTSEQSPDNKVLFGSFSKTSTRTIRRHIKDLISGGEIKRHQRGKTVTYTVTG